MKRYAEVLRVPHVAALIASTLLARFPIVHRAAAGDPQRADRLGRAVRRADGGLHLAGHRVRGGIAIGSAMAGGIVEASSWRLAFVVAAGSAAIGAVVAVARRGTLIPPVAA